MTSESAHRAIGVAVLGLGNVGSEVVRIIREQAEELEARVGAPLELRGLPSAVSARTAEFPRNCRRRTPSPWSVVTTSTSWSR
ncbi:putative homoserine dehydrogenase [Rhodococcus erythropolis SK121]|nr:putative homoserine dehydrogenase [Rhodococcus erythropolis SK121]